MEELMMNDVVVEEMVDIAQVAAEPVVEVVAKADKPATAIVLAAGIGIGLIAKPVYKKVVKPTAKKVKAFITKPKQIAQEPINDKPAQDATFAEEPKENKTK